MSVVVEVHIVFFIGARLERDSGVLLHVCDRLPEVFQLRILINQYSMSQSIRHMILALVLLSNRSLIV